MTNKFEIEMNRHIINQKGLGGVRTLPHEQAFNKGVDWFTELFLFYGFIFGLTFY
jgi:hypothetical protein